MIESLGIRVKPEIGLLLNSIFGYLNSHGQTLGLNHCPNQSFSLFNGWMLLKWLALGTFFFLCLVLLVTYLQTQSWLDSGYSHPSSALM